MFVIALDIFCRFLPNAHEEPLGVFIVTLVWPFICMTIWALIKLRAFFEVRHRALIAFCECAPFTKYKAITHVTLEGFFASVADFSYGA